MTTQFATNKPRFKKKKASPTPASHRDSYGTLHASPSSPSQPNHRRTRTCNRPLTRMEHIGDPARSLNNTNTNSNSVNQPPPFFPPFCFLFLCFLTEGTHHSHSKPSPPKAPNPLSESDLSRTTTTVSRSAQRSVQTPQGHWDRSSCCWLGKGEAIGAGVFEGRLVACLWSGCWEEGGAEEEGRC